MKRIGILGGMGPLATCDLYKKIILNTKADSDQAHVPVIIDSNTAIPDRTACILSGGENPLLQMIASIQRLEEAGADFIIMPCNTAHYFYDELAASTSLPVLHMLRLASEVVAEKAGKGGTVGLLATDGTVRSGIYSRILEQAGLTMVTPDIYQSKVMELIYDGIKKNNFQIGPEGLFSAIKEMEAQGASTFVLGCTELSEASGRFGLSESFVDPLLVLARTSIKLAGGALT